ncbi:uncharacterized protein LOC115884123 [Sitophilus oryzae]|uniref:Uncharacterized protein LOC115884123 n=1 Tax=Sitophilus oryzae TaxID=7048 RepID=A0A6J2Y5F7_SITOR|nr:uncharacterized protein LOC115884123 [Sitophilus oryzae]
MMYRKQQLNNIILHLGVFIIGFIDGSIQEYKHYSLGNPKLCSPLSQKKVKYEAVIVDEGQFINQHRLLWNVDNSCSFEVESIYSNGGVIAVIQNINLRKNESNGECIDYIQIRVQNKFTRRFCGNFNATSVMNQNENGEISSINSAMNKNGELDVTIFIDKEPLAYNTRTEFSVVFTSFKECSYLNYKHYKLEQCNEREEVCIKTHFFMDGLINCPYYGCTDEGKCLLSSNIESKGSVGDRVLIGSLSTLALLFALFCLLIWAFKKHKLFCWREDFAHPTPISDNNRSSCVMEMHEPTGIRLAEPALPPTQPSAPVDQGKDLPPSYDSLFPNSTNE